ncbi:MAG: bifunctional DNA-formamidopyrimidine glycosylase/DNA-(apurinic or apyrimidinic site) lyase [Thermoleophilia bacterium]|nr:bifunctional DNA-formamidopyrimidine glycosylase/DNA-(apurinic or apyrimidinic site) lyase [Thermoleophilia bacterium]
MPELPEVETIRRQLEPLLTGSKISSIEVLDPLAVAPASPEAFKRRLRGRAITAVRRRGKYLQLELDTQDTLVIHLRMTGTLTYLQLPMPKEERQRLRLLLHLDNGAGLAFHDTRRFGKAFILKAGDSQRYWARLGPEPLDSSFKAAYLGKILDGRTRPIKSLLLDQAMVAGIGNIYADEALYRAHIMPTRPAGDLDDEEIRRLTRSIKATLKKAIDLQGSSIDTYRDSQGRKGSFQETFQVHRRQGEPCPACGTRVEKIRVGGRGTYFCPICQK